MIFHTLDIYKLAAFKPVSAIERLELIFHSAVDIILGTNGSGKTSLLRELTPLPSPRSAYYSGGYKKLTLSHRGHEYEIFSDYANKNSPHSFKKDGVQLNDGGTTQVQEELVRYELGYTSEVDALVTGTYNFAKMTPGVRRTLLINLNPCQLGFVLDHNKQVSSKIRACKSNLAMLQERKLLLEQEFLPVDQKDQLIEEREALQKEVSKIIEFIHRTDERLKRVSETNDTDVDLPDIDWKQYVKQLSRSLYTFGKYQNVPRSNHSTYERNLLQTLSSYEGRLTVLREQQREVLVERNQDKVVLDELDDGEVALQVKLKEQTRLMELTELKAASCETPAPQDTIEEWGGVKHHLESVCTEFLDCAIRLRSDDELQKQRQTFQHWQYVFQENSLELQRLGEEVGRVKNLQKLKLTDIPDAPCSKHGCPLYVQFRTAYDRRVAELGRLEHRTAFLQNQNARLSAYLKERSTSFQKHAPFSPKIKTVQSYIERFGGVAKTNVLRMLQNDPLAIYRQIQDYMESSEATYKYRALQAEIEAEQWTHRAKRQVAKEEKDRLLQRVALFDQKYADLSQRIASGETKAAHIREQLSTLAEYTTLLKDLQTQHEYLTLAIKQAWVQHDQHQLVRLNNLLTQKRDYAIRRLGEIDHTLQKQTHIQARYDDEVILQLSKIEAERVEWQWMEAALARIPVSYTVTFLNSVIGTMNRYIAKVFSSPFFLLPVSESEPLDYQFPAQVGDDQIPDISFCSDAQMEIVNLTFRIALMKQLGLNDYPIHLDEVGRTFDTYHKQCLLELLRELLDDHVVSQMHLVNHHALIHEGLTNADILVLNDTNILLPPTYNEHAKFNHFH